jgi:2-polyprenyl-3-methyl-5-hydroxy-6-metoxy-1,4-benzoquinol methylase
MFEQRARGTEMLDSPEADADDAVASYRFMRMANVIGGARRLKQFVVKRARHCNGRTLHVLDVGAGDGSLARAVCRWADGRGLNLRFTCVDTDRSAARRARQLLAPDDPVRFVHGDVFDLEPDGYDCVTASMFLHHFPDERLAEVAAHLAGLGRGVLFINDLRRAWTTYAAAWLLSRACRRAVRHDATLSVRRGFQPQELAARLSRIPGARVRVGRSFPGRVWAEVTLAGETG